jgi:hypothetical protein
MRVDPRPINGQERGEDSHVNKAWIGLARVRA